MIVVFFLMQVFSFLNGESGYEVIAMQVISLRYDHIIRPRSFPCAFSILFFVSSKGSIVVQFSASVLDNGAGNLTGAGFLKASEAAFNSSFSERFLPSLKLIGKTLLRCYSLFYDNNC